VRATKSARVRVLETFEERAEDRAAMPTKHKS
jgi:hypothetical protein